MSISRAWWQRKNLKIKAFAISFEPFIGEKV